MSPTEPTSPTEWSIVVDETHAVEYETVPTRYTMAQLRDTFDSECLVSKLLDEIERLRTPAPIATAAGMGEWVP